MLRVATMRALGQGDAMTRAAALFLIMSSLAPALAQSAAPPSAPVYEPQLMRLSEIMGALHYLRTLCRAPEDGAWRREMQALIDAEAQSTERRERLTQSFNRGYSGFEATHRSCTPVVQELSRRYLDEGRRLVRDLTTRFVN